MKESRVASRLVHEGAAASAGGLGDRTKRAKALFQFLLLQTVERRRNREGGLELAGVAAVRAMGYLAEPCRAISGAEADDDLLAMLADVSTRITDVYGSKSGAAAAVLYVYRSATVVATYLYINVCPVHKPERTI